jgi:NOL1/NOP2/fmu family ribosome biogenesis protein
MRKELNQTEISGFGKKIAEQFGFRINPELKYFSKDEKEGNKIFLYSGTRIPEMSIEWVGLHFGTQAGDEFLPSLDGAQLMKTASKRLLEVGREEIEELMKGVEIAHEVDFSGAVLLKSGDLMCTGLAKDGKILSTTPKSRRI